ncbi:porin family protein [Pedobacter sp. MW01-1-1]|uniref:porin family protein n=1 Tax=Pedobacter sp. MW01-1-1 TaxID=3383027 RepID=UPI003FEF8148
MKSLKLTLIALFVGFYAHAQVVPSFQMGIKAGLNFAKFKSENTFDSDNRAGMYGGLWARLGGAGIHFQPELYITGKKTKLISNATGEENKVGFTSLDIPLLIGTKLGAAGVGLRLNTGPLFSFVLDEKQSFNQATGNIFRGVFKNQTYAWQFGAGVDIKRLNFDARYELGLSKVNKEGYPNTKLNLFTIGIGYRIF